MKMWILILTLLATTVEFKGETIQCISFYNAWCLCPAGSQRSLSSQSCTKSSSSSSTTSLKGKDETCSSSSDCKTSLKCIDGVCDCYTSEYYDSTCKPKPNYGDQCRSSTQCKNNLICRNGVCRCTDTQYFDSTCKPKSSYGDQCSSSTQCKDTLICRHSACGCTGTEFFDFYCKPKLDHSEECTPTISNTCSKSDNYCVPDITGKHRCLCDVSDYSRSGDCHPLSELRITNFQVQKIDPTQVRFTWMANDYGLQVNYTIQWTSEKGPSDKKEKNAGKNGVLLSDLTPGRQYIFSITSRLPGDTNYADKFTGVERKVDMLPSLPGPIDHDTSKLDSPPYNLTFQPSDGDVAKYKITLTVDGNSTFKEVIEAVEPRVENLDLLPERVYTYTIIAFNQIGEITLPVQGSFRAGPFGEDVEDGKDKINIPIVAGAAGASLALVATIIVIVGFVICKRKKADDNESSKQDAELSQKNINIHASYASNGYLDQYDKQYEENVYNQPYEEGYCNVSSLSDEENDNVEYDYGKGPKKLDSWSYENVLG